jgi:integrase
LYHDENGTRRKKMGYTDKRESQRLATELETEARKIRDGLVDRKDRTYRDRGRESLNEHIKAWQADLVARGMTVKHAEHTSNRVRRLVAVILGSTEAMQDHRQRKPEDRGTVAEAFNTAIGSARLSSMTREKAQDAIGKLRDAGWSLQTCNHYRASMRAFSKWCKKSGRTREDVLLEITPYNAKEDPRHERRAISLEEQQKLITAAHHGKTVMGMTGPERALCYRLALNTGFRHEEISSIHAESFNWEESQVTVDAPGALSGTAEPSRHTTSIGPQVADSTRRGLPHRNFCGLTLPVAKAGPQAVCASSPEAPSPNRFSSRRSSPSCPT